MDNGVLILVNLLWVLATIAVCASAVLIAFRKFESYEGQNFSAPLEEVNKNLNSQAAELLKLRNEMNQLKAQPAPRPRF